MTMGNPHIPNFDARMKDLRYRITHTKGARRYEYIYQGAKIAFVYCLKAVLVGPFAFIGVAFEVVAGCSCYVCLKLNDMIDHHIKDQLDRWWSHKMLRAHGCTTTKELFAKVQEEINKEIEEETRNAI